MTGLPCRGLQITSFLRIFRRPNTSFMFSRFFSRVGLLAAPFLAIIMAGCSKADMTVRQSTLFNDRFALPGLANYIFFTDFPPSEHILYVFSLL